MADVAKSPVKRKSVGGKPGSAKKPKVNANQTPAKGNIKSLNASPKQQNATPKPQNATPKPQKNTPKGQNGVQKTPKTDQKQKNKQPQESTKKMKPFEGTAAIKSPKIKKNKKGGKDEDKPKRALYFQYRQTLNSGDEAAKKQLATTLGNKIKSIEDRPDPLTKSAKRKLALLKKLKRSAEGGSSLNIEASKPVAKKVKVLTQQKAQPQKPKENKKVPNKKPKIEIEEEEDEDDSDEESDDDAEEDGEEDVEEESGDESDDEGEEEEDEDEEDDNEDSEEEESDEEDNPPPKQVKTKKTDKAKQQPNQKQSPQPSFNPTDIEELKKNQIVGQKQNRYILFVGNIPYDTKKDDLKEHFQKCGQLKHVRIPTEKKSLKPRGFAYVELEDAETYQKCLSMHHTFLKGRRINVLYTIGGKKKGEDKKKEIKAKNFKLHALRKQGKLAGSKKETQKRSFRRKKQKQAKSEPSDS